MKNTPQLLKDKILVLVREFSFTKTNLKILKELRKQKEVFYDYSLFLLSLESAYTSQIILSLMKILDNDSWGNTNSLQNLIQNVDEQSRKVLNNKLERINKNLTDIKLVRDKILAHSDEEYDIGVRSISLNDETIEKIEIELSKVWQLIEDVHSGLKLSGWVDVYFDGQYQHFIKFIDDNFKRIS